MKAIRVHEFGEADVLTYEDVPNPVAGPGEAVVEVKAAGVNPVETYIRAGIHLIQPELPFVPGGDAAGVVLSVGDGVGSLKPGDRVYAAGCVGDASWTGAYAEQLLRRAEDLLPLPDNISFAQGAALGVPYGTAQWALIRRGRAQAGETVLIHGGCRRPRHRRPANCRRQRHLHDRYRRQRTGPGTGAPAWRRPCPGSYPGRLSGRGGRTDRGPGAGDHSGNAGKC